MHIDQLRRAIEQHAAVTQQGPHPQTIEQVSASVARGDMEVVHFDADRTDVVYVSLNGL